MEKEKREEVIKQLEESKKRAEKFIEITELAIKNQKEKLANK